MLRRRIAIGVFVALVLVLPLRYYACADDPYDERFAWRMFSTTRLARCSVRMSAAGRDVPLARVFHVAWIKTAQRGRQNVVRAMARRLCDDPSFGAPVRVWLTCRHIDGRTDRVLEADEDLCDGAS